MSNETLNVQAVYITLPGNFRAGIKPRQFELIGDWELLPEHKPELVKQIQTLFLWMTGEIATVSFIKVNRPIEYYTGDLKNFKPIE